MPTAIPDITDLTDAAVTEAGFKTQLANLFAALRERGDPLGSSWMVQNLGLAFSVGGNALTCAVKQRDGSTNATATNAIAVPFRAATAANGGFNVRNVTGALSLTISSGSTLGHSNATASNTYWYLIDNSGTVELAASSKFFGWSGIVSTTAEGGAGAADSATTMYSTTARSSVPFICIAKTVDTQTTAGTWAAAPTTVSLAPFDLLDSPVFTGTPSLPTGTTAVTQSPGDNSTKVATTAYVAANKGGCVISTTTYTTNTSLTTIIPADDTIPQNTEGTEIMSIAYTPQNASSTILVCWEVYCGTSISGTPVAAPLFKDSGANALKTAWSWGPSNNNPTTEVVGSYSESAGSTSARTYKVRVGAGSGNVYPNGSGAATRIYGGTSECRMTVIEVLP